jgi:2-oxo-4-hydroxy-4-carboxy-5-ureidoimidazoline decarboxylase
MQLEVFNKQTKEEALHMISNCCGSSVWIAGMMRHFPFESEHELFKKAREIWFEQCDEKDWLEAFTHHPKIGDLESLTKKFAATKALASFEQKSVQTADALTIAELAKGNSAYEKKFGFIFIVCATGKTAKEMLLLLTNRLLNSYEVEVKIAMQEQAKITTLRLQKLLAR